MKKILFNLIPFLLLLGTLNTYTSAQEAPWETIFNNPYITSIENSDFGLLAGEFNNNTGGQVYNGVYVTRTLGKSWELLGLKSRGVTSLIAKNNTLYATTYYHLENLNGLFTSNDKGKTWEHLGINVSTTHVDEIEGSLLLGTFNHGLWLSKDQGINWVQKIGNGWFGPKITLISTNTSTALVSTSLGNFISTDKGSTWNELQSLKNLTIKTAYINDAFILIGTASQTGLKISSDNGLSWTQIPLFENSIVGSITEHDNKIYISLSKNGIYDVVETNFDLSEIKSLGLDTNLGTAVSNGLKYTKAAPDNLIISFSNYGILKLPVYNDENPGLTLLDPPWDLGTKESLTTNISGFFDHEFPLYGYSEYSETEEAANTTVNFLGQKEEEPYIYYSSHNGIDFALPYGTEVLATQSGYASYYHCNSCGNTIKIDHLNGYQTTYMHLQTDHLITTDTPVFVEKGEVIGRVGMTGNTTGPHLHFSVMADLNLDGNFTDNIPDGRVDPFGWQSKTKKDPWATYEWTDVNGNHKGSISNYLWSIPLDTQQIFIGGGETKDISLKDKVITFISNLGADPFTADAVEGPKPQLPKSQLSLKHASSTSLIVDITSPTGKDLGQIDGTMKVKFQLDQKDLENISFKSLKVYFWNKIKKLWEPILSKLNEEEQTIEGETNHFSHFAVFGEKLDPNPPITSLLVEGTKTNEWFIENPLISFSVTDPDNTLIDKTFYTIENAEPWIEYKQPFSLNGDGIISIQFRSVDSAGNLEETNTAVIKINKQNNWVDKVKINDNSFSFGD